LGFFLNVYLPQNVAADIA
jgi:hypothetical protein